MLPLRRSAPAPTLGAYVRHPQPAMWGCSSPDGLAVLGCYCRGTPSVGIPQVAWGGGTLGGAVSGARCGKQVLTSHVATSIQQLEQERDQGSR